MASLLRPDDLLMLYRRGEFLMADSRDDPRLFKLDPEQRGILPLDQFHVPRKLARTIKQMPYRVTVDHAFLRVLVACAEPTPDRPNSWINDAIVNLYDGLFRNGHAHSVECWEGTELVGGLYGVAIGAVFFGESMFSRKRDASKIALVHLVARLRVGGFQLLDTQFVTDHLQQFGAIEISRARFKTALNLYIDQAADFFRLPRDCPADQILQSITQTS